MALVRFSARTDIHKNRNRLCINETNVLFCIITLVIIRSHIRLWSTSFFMWSTSINSSFRCTLSCSFRSTPRIRRVCLSCRFLFLTEGKLIMSKVVKKSQPAWSCWQLFYCLWVSFLHIKLAIWLMSGSFLPFRLFQSRCHLCDPSNVPERAKLWWSLQEIKREKS
jgi:hypothetical protein